MKKRANARRSAGFATCMIFSCWASAFALDARLDVSQYAHTAWRVSDGFLKGVIFAIDQTPDGYLWFGTEFGLLRFDCARAGCQQLEPGCREDVAHFAVE